MQERSTATTGILTTSLWAILKLAQIYIHFSQPCSRCSLGDPSQCPFDSSWSCLHFFVWLVISFSKDYLENCSVLNAVQYKKLILRYLLICEVWIQARICFWTRVCVELRVGSDSAAVLQVAVLVSDGEDGERGPLSPGRIAACLVCWARLYVCGFGGFGPGGDFSMWVQILGACLWFP